MGWQPGAGPGPGEEPDPGGGVPGPGARDARLGGFAAGGEWDAAVPSAALAVALEGVSGPGWRCPGAGHDELLGVLRRWAALESWAAAGKLGTVRALIREEDLPLPGGGHHGDLPDGWSKSLAHEVSLALAMPPVSADKLMWQAWDLQAALPGIGRLLADGTLTPAKAKAIDEALAALSEEDRARAEAMIVPQLAGKTYGQAEKLAIQAAITVDPGGAERLREDAERNRARVALKREGSGAASLSGYDLPTDETLAAHAQGLRPRPGVQGLRGVPRCADGPVPRPRLPRHHQRGHRRGPDQPRPARHGPGRPRRPRPRRESTRRGHPGRPGRPGR